MYHEKLNSTNDKFNESNAPCIAKPPDVSDPSTLAPNKNWLTKERVSFPLLGYSLTI